MTREEAIVILMNSNEYHHAKGDLPHSALSVEAFNMAIEALKERPHGEWLSHYDYCKKHDCIPSGLIALWWCNQCEQGVEHPTNFCPNCGADMRKER